MNCICLSNCTSSLNFSDILQKFPCCFWICIAVIVILIVAIVFVIDRCHNRAYKESLIEMCMWKSKTYLELEELLKVINRINKS